MVGLTIINGKLDVLEIDDEKSYEKIVEVVGSPFSIVRRKVGNSYIDIYCDDELLLKGDKLNASGVCGDAYEILGGNLLFLDSNNEGKSISLSNSQVKDIIDNVVKMKKDVSLMYMTSVGVKEMVFKEKSCILKYKVS